MAATVPSPAEFERAALDAIARLPDEFRRRLADVVLRIEEFAGAEQLASAGIADRWDLTGLYEGVPIPEQSLWDPARMPPVISLFRQPLLREMEETGVAF
ncbi:MAG: metallopeptidase family protein, partial [Parvibaculum sp.]